MANHVHKSCHRFLALFKLVRFFLAALFIITKEWFYEVKQLLNSFGCLQLALVFDDCFADSKCNCALICELHVVHKGRVVVHLQNSD